MPTKYEIPNVNDAAIPCDYCGGTGFQNMGAGLGYRQCQYCVQGYKVTLCHYCAGHGCSACMGTLHQFHSELIQQSRIQLPDTSTRRFADGATPAPPRLVQRRR